jgi:hypothetical protein
MKNMKGMKISFMPFMVRQALGYFVPSHWTSAVVNQGT